mgnify:CR=1 FL=1
MELNDYQREVLHDLGVYLQTLIDCGGDMGQAFRRFWQERGVLQQTYKQNVQGVPHVCVKVPTAGGKTYIAVNAIERIFSALDEYNPSKPKFVVWLVPSLTILEQTVKNLSNIEHPYRQRLNELFNGRVQVYEKSDVLLGADFNADTVRGQLSLVVMSFDSLKATNKENRKAYQENGYLASFLQAPTDEGVLLPEYDKSALINVIRSLRPVVVVDESHNAESQLSVDMLRNLNPSFILDLTATPRENSNIISYVDALRLKNMNMVKLPVIVANQRSQEDVIMAALNMRRQLEAFAQQAEADGGPYIRPIVLFQAEPRNKDDTTTFDKVKQTLLSLNIPAEHIAIKTASINELKGVELMGRDCQVRYIITVNALKEGWDCPFAYVLATLANKSSVVDVTQILGRVLRMPYVRKHKAEFLNLSYVFTSSSNFQETLNLVVAGLNRAGFSDRSYRQVDLSQDADAAATAPGTQDDWLHASTTGDAAEGNGTGMILDGSKLNVDWEAQAVAAAQAAATTADASGDATAEQDTAPVASDAVERIKAQALTEAKAFNQQAEHATGESCPQELREHMNQHRMKPMFEASAKEITLPQFVLKVQTDGGFFDSSAQWLPLSKDNLLSGFVLANLDATMNFAAVDADVFRVDAEDTGDGQSAVQFRAIKKAEKDKFNQVIKGQSPAGQVRSIVDRLFSLLGKNAFYPIDDPDVRAYLKRIVEALSSEQRGDCLARDYAYVKVIKKKIQSLASEHAAREFNNWLTTQKVRLQPSFVFTDTITPSDNAPAISKSLYVTEAGINGLEVAVIRAVAALDNIVWWHRNLERGKGFVINGFINHYADFIVLTENKNIIVIEAKGDDRDNTDSKDKLKLGKTWESEANQLSHQTGYRYRYMMVFENNPLEGALSLGDALKLVAEL